MSDKMPDFPGPRIPERDRAVPDLFITGGIGIEGKIAESLKLIAFRRMHARKGWLAFRSHDFQRIWIYK